MGILRRLSVGAAALLLSGCWLQPGYGPERQNFNPFENHLTPENAATLQQAWSTPWDTGGQPLVTPAAVITGSARLGSLTVRAASRGSGAPLWRRDLALADQFGTGAVLSVANDQVLTARFAPAGLVIETLDPATGATTATASVPELFVPERAVVNSDVLAYEGLTSGVTGLQLVVRTRDTLELLWTASLSSLSIGVSEPLIIAGGRIYLRGDDVDSNTPVIQTYAVGGCGAATCSPESALVVPPPPPETGFAAYEARLLTVTDDGHLLVHRSWQDDRGVFPGTDLIALAPDGTLDWRLPLDAEQAGLLGVAAAGDMVFAVGADGATPPGEATLFGLSATSGEVAWRADGVSHDVPIAAGELAYVAGEVFAADGCGSASCSPLATVDVSGLGGIFGESVTAGTLFVNKAGSGLDGRLIAFAPTG